MQDMDRNPGSPYRVPTHPVEARLVLANGKRSEVTLFLASLSGFHSGPETMDEFLNRCRKFLPVRLSQSNQGFLVNRDAVQRVEVGPSVPVLLRMEGRLATYIDLARLEMSDGSILEGTLPYVVSPENPRLSDFLNHEDRFFPLEMGSEVVYVNKEYVVAVYL